MSSYIESSVLNMKYWVGVIGAIKGTSLEDLYMELERESSNDRCWF